MKEDKHANTRFSATLLDYVRIYISHLRQKIEPSAALPKYILIEPGVGYYFKKAD